VIICPKCSARAVVIDTRESGHTVKRRRKCPECGARWSTWEVMFDEGMNIDAAKEASIAAMIEAKITLRDALERIQNLERHIRGKVG
jgi:transcriptional regulator NrdR family protein